MELPFNTGDIIYVYGDMDDDGFFMSEINGIRGLVPSNFLSEAPADGRRGRHTSSQYIHPNSARNLRGQQMSLTQQQMMSMRQRPTSLDLNQMGQPRFGQPGMQQQPLGFVQQMMGQQPGMQPPPGPMMGAQGMMGPQGQFMQPGMQPPPGQMTQMGPPGQQMQPTQQQTAQQQQPHQQTSLISSLFGGKKDQQQTQQQTQQMMGQQPGMQPPPGQMGAQGMMGGMQGPQMPGQQGLQTQMGMPGTTGAYGQPQMGPQGILLYFNNFI